MDFIECLTYEIYETKQIAVEIDQSIIFLQLQQFDLNLAYSKLQDIFPNNWLLNISRNKKTSLYEAIEKFIEQTIK